VARRGRRGKPAACSRALKEMRCVSGLVLGVEQLERGLVQLGARCRTNFLAGARLGANRDFRIDLAMVRRALLDHDDDQPLAPSVTIFQSYHGN